MTRERNSGTVKTYKEVKAWKFGLCFCPGPDQLHGEYGRRPEEDGKEEEGEGHLGGEGLVPDVAQRGKRVDDEVEVVRTLGRMSEEEAGDEE